MIDSTQVYKQVTDITTRLIMSGLSVKQNFPSMKNINGITEISWEDKKDLSIVLKNVNYKNIYNELEKENNFNIKLIDGALMQLMYRFDGKKLISHRLAFFPSPELEYYQNDPSLYEKEQIYADILSKQIIPFPIRFDFDMDLTKHIEIDHPISHITLGQYKNCRIPVCSAITPYLFADFILRNFYHSSFSKYLNGKDMYTDLLPRTIVQNEEGVLHLNIN
ncbi:DUF2290 domain-containing protein [Bacillus wiedmannii]|uniref:DUF2290 domain-containing protein n=1 Tax=Bacillus cereus group TaxID=86661 RepID=UPI002D7FBCF6|nr:DUF2290 domain-containing protein [Bacillus thuringiensis]MEB4814941.1 DUF2290 domain-containing protein [Bacillus thuringiensis]